MNRQTGARLDVLEVVRIAMREQATGNTRPVVNALRNRLRGLSKPDRLQFEATLAWTAGELALRVPEAEREAFFERLSWTDAQLAARLLEIVGGA